MCVKSPYQHLIALEISRTNKKEETDNSKILTHPVLKNKITHYFTKSNGKLSYINLLVFRVNDLSDALYVKASANKKSKFG